LTGTFEENIWIRSSGQQFVPLRQMGNGSEMFPRKSLRNHSRNIMANLLQSATKCPSMPSIHWLDRASASGVVDIVESVAAHHPEVQAVILFGSVARREQRPLDDAEPSDVDLLLIVDPSVLEPSAERLTSAQDLALTRTISEADFRHRAPREINTFFMNRDLARWDTLFIENVARDGILLWARGPLPEPLAPVAARTFSSLLSPTAN
jgi:predicted nucleotidyltransferase